MKAFWIYTGLRVLLFVGSFAIVFAVWAIFSKTISVLWVLLIAAALSSVASWKLLAVPRERFAQQVQERADRAASRFEEIKAKEDDDLQDGPDA